MAVPGAEDVYLTLLLTDTYLPGALVLAHSLRDGGTTKKLGVLVTLDSVSAEAITQLETVYDYVIPVPRIRNAYPANLSLMNRVDLHSAFTKINLWKQTSFRKIVYIDADVVAYRAPDELFDIAHPFSAAPDIGWPDLFNSGVMVLTPSIGEYYALMALAERGISFDGADQGLLNMHFKNNFNRLSFTYNVTPSAHYQYVPAYRHFQSSINMVHFIGSEKPWFQGRHASTGSSPFDEMIGRWWAVYDRHYRVASPKITPTQPTPELVRYLTRGEFQPEQPRITRVEHVERTGELYSEHHDRDQQYQPSHPHSQHEQTEHHHYTQQHHYHHDHHDHHGEQHHDVDQPENTVQSHEHSSESPSASLFTSSIEGTEAEARKEQVPEPHYGVPPPPPEQKKPEPPPITMSDWDAQRHPPPTDSKPEAVNFPATIYEMSQDASPFVPPERYPSPPKDMWYEVPKEPPAARAAKPKLIFPWETNQAPPSRVFVDDLSRVDENESGASSTPTGELHAYSENQPSAETSVTEHSTAGQEREPVTPTTPTINITPVDPWTSYTRTNAWDEVPEIERYVEGLQKHRRSRSLKSPGVIQMPGVGDGDGAPNASDWGRRGSKLTDFPTAAERPSLPVTPAPIRRPKFWGGGGPGIGDGDDDDPLLPAAEGVPGQSEWDPVKQLQKLAKQQSEVLLQKLGGAGARGRDSGELPARPVPFGSEELTSPTYVAQSAQLLSPQPVKGGTSSVILSDREAIPRSSTEPVAATSPALIPEPSYHGPGASFEKGEDYLQQDTPMPPTEEEQDVLET